MSCYFLVYSKVIQLYTHTHTHTLTNMDFPGDSVGKESACNVGDPWVGKIPWRRAWQPTPVFLPGESHRQKSLAGYGLWCPKESDTTEATWHACTMTCIHHCTVIQNNFTALKTFCILGILKPNKRDRNIIITIQFK